MGTLQSNSRSKKESCFNILFLSALKKRNVSNITIHNQIQQYEMYKKHFNKTTDLQKLIIFTCILCEVETKHYK